MKTPSLFFCVATAAAATLATTTHAANCTTEQLASLGSMAEVKVVSTACAGFNGSIEGITSESPACNTTCLAALDAVIKVVPVCEVSGALLSGRYSSVVTACKAATSAATPITSASLVAMAFAVGSALMGVAMVMA